MVLYVPKTGFVPGQNIPLTIELDNDSNWPIHGIQIKLERVIFFRNNNFMIVFNALQFLGIII